MAIVRACRHQRAHFGQRGADRAIGRVEFGIDDAALPGQPQPVIAITAITFDREHRFQPMRLAQQKVVFAVVGRHMHKPGARFGGDEIARQKRPRPREKAAQFMHRVARDGAFECGALDIEMRGVAVGPGALHKGVDQRFGHQIAPPGQFDQEIIDRFAIGDRLVGGDRPRRGGPDHRKRANQIGIGAFDDFKRHIDLGRGDILVFNFRLGQCGLFHRAPHHRLGAAIELATFGKAHQFAHDGRLGGEIHRQIGIVPVAVDAQPFELRTLHIDPVAGIGAAFGAEFARRHFVLVLLFLAIFFFDFPFDRQTVAIPARHIWRIKPAQRARAHDHILEDVVQRMADMHVAIGIRRAIVENELFAPGARIAQGAIKIIGFPARQNAWLFLRQASLHRKIGLRQEDGGTVIALLGHGAAP